MISTLLPAVKWARQPSRHLCVGRWGTTQIIVVRVGIFKNSAACFFFAEFRCLSLPVFFRWISLNFAALFFAEFRCFSLPFFSLNFAAFRCPFFSLNFAAFRCPFPSLNSAACFFRCPLFSLPFTAAHFYYFSLLTLSAAFLVELKYLNLPLLQLYKGMFLMLFSSAITNWITLMFRLFSLWLCKIWLFRLFSLRLRKIWLVWSYNLYIM